MTKVNERVRTLTCFENPTKIEPLDGGITNVNLRVTDQGNDYVVRLGADIPEHGIMRWNEVNLSKAAHALGVSPEVVHHEPGVLVLEFLSARTFTEQDVRTAENLPRIVDLIAKTHRGLGAHLTQPVLTFWPYQVNQTYVTRLRVDGTKPSALLDELMNEQEKLIYATGPVELVIGHNDLLAANIMDDSEQLWLIDWEYGGYNTPLFDLAGVAGNNEFSEAQESQMLAQYFGNTSDNHWRPYQAMKCASLMREALWSMTSELHSELDFDYVAYTEENLTRLRAALADFHNT